MNTAKIKNKSWFGDQNAWDLKFGGLKTLFDTTRNHFGFIASLIVSFSENPSLIDNVPNFGPGKSEMHLEFGSEKSLVLVSHVCFIVR